MRIDPTPSESPCIGICSLDPSSGLCVGCGRDMAEIAGWAAFDADRRQAVMGALPSRLAAIATKAG